MMEVGPVLQADSLGGAVVEAITAQNPQARVIDRGSYLRVLVPGRCVLLRAAVEERTGATFRFPGDLELVMPSFQGQLEISEDRAEWRDPGGDHDS